MKRILCVGDACADVVIPYGSAKRGEAAEPHFSPGGTVANTASGLGRLGAECAFLGKAGDDYFGRQMRAALAQDGVDVSRFYLDGSLSSVLILAVLDEQNDRFPFLMPRRQPSHLELYPGDLPDELLDSFDLVHTSGLMLFENPAAESVCGFLERCRVRGVEVSLDVNLRVETARGDFSFLRRAADCASYLLGSGPDELAPLAGLADPDAAARSLVRGSRAVVCRLGAQGARVYTAAGVSSCGAFPVQVADTLGAGDCYNSGFLFALASGANLAAANVCGCAAAAVCLTRPGARGGPTRAELFDFLSRNGVSL